MTNSFTQRQLDAIADFNWGSSQPARHHRAKANEIATEVPVENAVNVQRVDPVQAEALKPADNLAWH